MNSLAVILQSSLNGTLVSLNFLGLENLDIIFFGS